MHFDFAVFLQVSLQQLYSLRLYLIIPRSKHLEENLHRSYPIGSYSMFQHFLDYLFFLVCFYENNLSCCLSTGIFCRNVSAQMMMVCYYPDCQLFLDKLGFDSLVDLYLAITRRKLGFLLLARDLQRARYQPCLRCPSVYGYLWYVS